MNSSKVGKNWFNILLIILVLINIIGDIGNIALWNSEPARAVGCVGLGLD